MHRFPTEQIVLVVLEASILLGLVLRIWLTKLFRTYPWFFAYLVMAFVQTVVSPFIPFDSVIYRYYWLVTQALLTCFCALIVLELYGLVLRDLKGIASASRRYLKICMGIAILASLLLLLVEKTPDRVVNTFLIIERALVTSLLIFVLLLTAFLAYYPVPINRNLVVYSMGYAVYFMAKASGLLAMNITHAWRRQADVVVIAASMISMLFWLVGLSREGEEKALAIGHRWKREDQEKVIERLKAINASLLDAGRH
jgi:hypothetical protein